MASTQGNLDALNAVVQQLSAALGLDLLAQPVPGVQRPDLQIERVWLPATATFARPTTLAAYAQLPRDPHQAIRVEARKAYTLTLDSEWTTPAARIGVKFGSAPSSRTDCTVLTPGESISVPQGFSTFYVYAADNLDLYGKAPGTCGVVGFVSFLVGHSIGAIPRPTRAHPQARVIAIGGNYTGSPGFTFLAPEHCKRVRVNHFPLNKDGTLVPGTTFHSTSVLCTKLVRPGVPGANLGATNIFFGETPDQGATLGVFGYAGLNNRMRCASSWNPTWAALPNITPKAMYFEVEPGQYYALTHFTTKKSDGTELGAMYVVEACDEFCPANAPHTELLWHAEALNPAGIDTGSFPFAVGCCDYDSLAFDVTFSAARTVAVIATYYATSPLGDLPVAQQSILAATAIYANGWGAGTGIAVPPPNFLRVTLSAAGQTAGGVDITEYLNIWGNRIRDP